MVLVTWPVSACPPGSGDLRRAVADRPEDLVALIGWRAAEKGLTKEWIYVFPDDLSFFGDFEEASERRLGDQRIPVRQPLRAAHARRGLVLILPHDLVCRRIDLDCPRIRYSIVEAMRAVAAYPESILLAAAPDRAAYWPDSMLCSSIPPTTRWAISSGTSPMQCKSTFPLRSRMPW